MEGILLRRISEDYLQEMKVFLGKKSNDSTDRFSHLSEEETLETGDPYKENCIDNLSMNAYRNGIQKIINT